MESNGSGMGYMGMAVGNRRSAQGLNTSSVSDLIAADCHSNSKQIKSLLIIGVDNPSLRDKN